MLLGQMETDRRTGAKDSPRSVCGHRPSEGVRVGSTGVARLACDLRREVVVRVVRWIVGAAILAYLGALAANRSQVQVRGSSMEPTLQPGDRLLTVPAIPRALRAGRVVVVADPADPGHLVVKRLADVDCASVEVRGDAPERSTDSRTWGRLPRAAVRRIVVARWPDLRTPLHRDLPRSPTM